VDTLKRSWKLPKRIRRGRFGKIVLRTVRKNVGICAGDVD